MRVKRVHEVKPLSTVAGTQQAHRTLLLLLLLFFARIIHQATLSHQTLLLQAPALSKEWNVLLASTG